MAGHTYVLRMRIGEVLDCRNDVHVELGIEVLAYLLGTACLLASGHSTIAFLDRVIFISLVSRYYLCPESEWWRFQFPFRCTNLELK